MASPYERGKGVVIVICSLWFVLLVVLICSVLSTSFLQDFSFNGTKPLKKQKGIDAKCQFLTFYIQEIK